MHIIYHVYHTLSTPPSLPITTKPSKKNMIYQERTLLPSTPPPSSPRCLDEPWRLAAATGQQPRTSTDHDLRCTHHDWRDHDCATRPAAAADGQHPACCAKHPAGVAGAGCKQQPRQHAVDGQICPTDIGNAVECVPRRNVYSGAAVGTRQPTDSSMEARTGMFFLYVCST